MRKGNSNDFSFAVQYQVSNGLPRRATALSGCDRIPSELAA